MLQPLIRTFPSRVVQTHLASFWTGGKNLCSLRMASTHPLVRHVFLFGMLLLAWQVEREYLETRGGNVDCLLLLETFTHVTSFLSP